MIDFKEIAITKPRKEQETPATFKPKVTKM